MPIDNEESSTSLPTDILDFENQLKTIIGSIYDNIEVKIVDVPCGTGILVSSPTQSYYVMVEEA